VSANPSRVASRTELTASFRDPAGSLFIREGRVLRIVSPAGQRDALAFLNSRGGRKAMESGRVVRSEALEDSRTTKLLREPSIRSLFETIEGAIIVEHERIPFPSFPYEWPPEMLHAAGTLTLDLAQELLNEGLGLKDATPYNVLFRGPEPVFIDLLSFEKRDPRDAAWLAYAQLVRTFLLPLIANRQFGFSLDQILTTRRDGLEPEDVYQWLGLSQKIRPPFLSLVSMPKWLTARHDPDDTNIYKKHALRNPEKARFILDALMNRIRRGLQKLEPRPGKKSTWSDYMGENNNYTAGHFDAKQQFVAGIVREFAPKRVLDVGCNTGHFSAIAARGGASVVAIDYDPVVLGDVWRMARAQKLDIQPLAVNLTRPTSGIGWRNRECPSFLDRATGAFDGLLMLAVIHHMLVTERIPLPDILEMASELTTGLAVIEFIAPEDSMFRRLVRGREELHKDLNNVMFENLAGRYFHIVRVQHEQGTSRWLYALRKK
jgi:2-polyprenyl-3-methyl-5-hydroxy-6-metoxy-1,4-benzoquinol methylase